MNHLQLVRLTPLMSRGQGRREVAVALIDGPVALDHPDLSQSTMKEIPGAVRGSCARPQSVACMHGTFVAGMLAGRRGSQAPAICPGCTLILRPIFPETTKDNHPMPSASPEELATAITDAIEAGAKVINLSAALTNPSSRGRTQTRAGPGLRCSSRRAGGCGGGKPEHSRQLRHHPASLGNSGGGLRSSRQAHSGIESRQLDRPVGTGRAGREHCQPRGRRQAANFLGHQRRSTICHWRHCAVVVGVPEGHRSPNQVSHYASRQAAPHHRSALAGCLGGVSDDEGKLVQSFEKRLCNRARLRVRA